MDLSKANLIHEFDECVQRIRRTCNEVQLKEVLKSLDHFLSSFSVVPKPLKEQQEEDGVKAAQKKAAAAAERGGKSVAAATAKSHERLSRLNVTKLSEAPVFELVCDFGRSHLHNIRSPVICFDAGSEIFMVGDVFVHKGQRREYFKPFFNVLSVDTAKSPSFLPCPPTIASGLAGQKVDPLVVTLQGKTYVLALQLYVGEPCFEVFDNGKWETLPCPPFFPCSESEVKDCLYPFNARHTRECFDALYAWDHKIVVCLERGISYCFDTTIVEWINMQNIYAESEKAPVLQCVAEYNKFLIAKPFFSEELVVYELDAHGFPHFYQSLDELEEMFVDSRIKCFTNAFIIPFNDDADKFCFICSGITDKIQFLLRVAVFRMAISNLDGKKKLTAVLEAHQIHPFYPIGVTAFHPDICLAFLKRDNLNLDNLKADRSLGRACSD